MNNLLQWLQAWYGSQCDGDWEHEHGIKILTLDNPGWDIYIDLNFTELDGTEIEIKTLETNESDWVQYSIKNNVFNGKGDPAKLEYLISLFKEIADKKVK